MPRKQIKSTKRKIVWTKPVWLVRSNIFENLVVAIFDSRDAAEAYVTQDPNDLYIEASGLNNDYIVIDED